MVTAGHATAECAQRSRRADCRAAGCGSAPRSAALAARQHPSPARRAAARPPLEAFLWTACHHDRHAVPAQILTSARSCFDCSPWRAGPARQQRPIGFTAQLVYGTPVILPCNKLGAAPTVVEGTGKVHYVLPGRRRSVGRIPVGPATSSQNIHRQGKRHGNSR